MLDLTISCWILTSWLRFRKPYLCKPQLKKCLVADWLGQHAHDDNKTALFFPLPELCCLPPHRIPSKEEEETVDCSRRNLGEARRRRGWRGRQLGSLTPSPYQPSRYVKVSLFIWQWGTCVWKTVWEKIPIQLLLFWLPLSHQGNPSQLPFCFLPSFKPHLLARFIWS